tara:strand:- start:77 stop:421 length:345 start_codon:yes stop_codon:yes gene_type:complete
MGKINWKNIKLFSIIILTFSCAPRIDYFSNPVDLKKEIIYLTKIREDSSIKDKYYLTFRQIYEIKEHEISLKNKTLERYLMLIMNYYGYSEKIIISRKNKNFLKPLFYVTVQFK